MKRTIAIVSTMLVLLVALCACGRDSKDEAANGGTAQPNTQTENGTNANENANGGNSANAGNNANAGGVLDGSGNTTERDERSDGTQGTIGDAVGGMVGGAAGAVEGALDGARNGMQRGANGMSAEGGRYARMVENGVVRDTDGFLADGENRSDNRIF